VPLPVEGAPWPPPELEKALDRFETYDAWWSGDAEALREHYQRETGVGFVNRPAQYAGGLAGKVARMWWGRPVPANEPDAKLHVPLAGDVCQAYADLLFGEPIVATSEHAATSTRLDELLDEGAHARLLEAAEVVAALGGGYLRPMHDAEVSDRPWIDAVPPDAAQPEWRGGRLAGVNFWRVVRTDKGMGGELVWRHVERHEPGFIVHALYQGTADKIGRMVPLEDAPATAALAGVVNEAGAVETEWPRLDVVYVPRISPNRRWRKSPALAPMGRSLLDGCEPLFDALDETYSSWMRDVRLAKGRLFAAESVLDNYGVGRGAGFDPDREFYAAVPGMLGRDERLTVVQFSIRVAEHRDTSRELVNTILRRVGLNGATLGEPSDGGPAITAREVAARERRSMLTRERGIRYWAPELRHLLGALLATDRRVFSTDVQPDAALNVEFPDSVSEDLQSLATTADLLNRAQSASIRTRVELLHPDWDETQVLAEVAAIEREAGPVIDAPFPGDGDDEFVEQLDEQLDEDSAA
jgi:hypothetical protein